MHLRIHEGKEWGAGTIRASFCGEEADGPPEQPLEPLMASRRLELGMDGSPLESEKRPVQFGRERSIA